MAAVGNYEIVSEDFPLSGGSPVFLDETVAAPSGKKVLSGGWDAQSSSINESRVHSSHPVSSGDGWRVNGAFIPNGSFSSGDKVTLFAVVAEMGACAS